MSKSFVNIFVLATLFGTSCAIRPESDTTPSLVAGYLVGNAGQTVAASYYVSTNYAVTANQAVNFDTRISDTNNAVSPGVGNTWKFTAPTSQRYRVSIVGNTVGTAASFALYKNGSNFSFLCGQSSTGTLVSGSLTLSLAVGDTISVNSTTTTTIVGSGAPYQGIINIEAVP